MQDITGWAQFLFYTTSLVTIVFGSAYASMQWQRRRAQADTRHLEQAIIQSIEKRFDAQDDAFADVLRHQDKVDKELQELVSQTKRINGSVVDVQKRTTDLEKQTARLEGAVFGAKTQEFKS